MAQGFGVSSFDVVRRELSRLVASLEAAVEQGTIQAWSEEIAWLRRSYETRGLAPEFLAEAVARLGEVLEEDLPSNAWSAVKPAIQLASDVARAPSAAESSFLDTDTEEGRLAAEYLVAALEGDRRRACKIVLDAAKDRGALEVYLKILSPAQAEVGRLWHANELSIAEEHIVTATTQTALGQLYAALGSSPANDRTVLAGAISGDLHDLGVRMAADVLEMAGFHVVFMGPDVPPFDFAKATLDFDADLVLIGATRPANIRAVKEAVSLLHQLEDRQVGVLVGGKAFAYDDNSWMTTGADGYASNAQTVVSEAHRVLGLG